MKKKIVIMISAICIAIGCTHSDVKTVELDINSPATQDVEQAEQINLENGEVYEAYNAAINLRKSDLTKTSKGYSYEGLDLLKVDCEWLDNPLNTAGTVNSGAIYRKMAYLLEGFTMRVNNYLDYAEFLIDEVPETRDEFVKYVDNAATFITREDQMKNIMKKMESLSCVSGDFDYEYGKLGKYSFTVDDLSECAKEMQISEKMLGHVFALLNEYAATTEFNGNSCTFSYEGFMGN